MAKVLSFETIPHFYWKNDKGVKPANGIQLAFCGDFIISRVLRGAFCFSYSWLRLPNITILGWFTVLRSSILLLMYHMHGSG